MKPELSILMVNYNTREMTLASLRSVYAETRETTFEIIMVDNASRDGSAEAIRAEFPDVKLIACGENLGFAGGTNLAAERAEADHLLLLNTDTIVLHCAIDRALAFARERPEAGIWGGRTLFGDGTLNPTSCWRRMTPWSLFCRVTGLRALFSKSEFFDPEGYGGWKRDCVRQVDIVTGCFFLIGRDLWQRLGGFDAAFFMYGEEADLCLRAAMLGAQPLICPKATIVHYGGCSATVRHEKEIQQMKAKVELIKRHWVPAWRPFGRFLLLCLAASRALAGKLRAAFRPTEPARQFSSAWLEVWRARRTWLAGYGDASTQDLAG